jgi:type I restriction enzyme S subunit
MVRPLFALVLTILNQNLRLAATRDLLLPKLISGEIDVSDLDIAIGEDAA